MRRLVFAALVVGGSTLTGPPAGAVAGFGDVEPDRYYTEAVQWLVDEEITTGTSPTCFSPDGLVTRGQTAAFLYRMESEPTPAVPHPFDDVTLEWQQDAVSWMHATGVTTGTSPTTFSPNTLVTRGQVATLLHRLAGELSAPPHPFDDVTLEWQQDAVSWMHATGVTTGTSPTTFSPELPLTRAQLATFLHRYSDRPPVVIDPDSPWCAADGSTRTVFETGYGPIAAAGPLTVSFPAARTELVGYHESSHDGAQQLAPAVGDVPSTTMETRHRGTGSRTAVDIVVDPRAEILAPVTGTVVRAGGYTLYCDHRDEFVVIEPDARPGWEVKMFHFEGLAVAPGDRVVAGATRIGTNAALLPFVSQIDELTVAPSWPHVHVEVVDPSVPDRPSARGC